MANENEALEAAAKMLAMHVATAWPHGASSFHVNQSGQCTVYVHRYRSCEIGSGDSVAKATARALAAAAASWPSPEAARAARIEKLRAELAAEEAAQVPA